MIRRCQVPRVLTQRSVIGGVLYMVPVFIDGEQQTRPCGRKTIHAHGQCARCRKENEDFRKLKESIYGVIGGT